MLGKLALLFKGKLAAAILGTALLAGGGTTAVLAANGAQLQLPLISQAQGQEHSNGNDANDDHGDNNQGATSNNSQQVEGTVSSIDSGHSSFVVKPGQGAAVTVVVNAQTEFEEGVSSFSALKVGLHVEAKGTLQANGSLLATKVEGQNDDANDNQDNDQNENELRGTVSSIDAGNSSFVLKLSGGTTKTVVVSAQTVFDGGLHKLADLKVGQSLEVKGNAQSNGTLAATRIHGEDNDANDDNGGANQPGDDHGDNSGSGGSGNGGSGNGGSGSSGSGGSGRGGHDDGADN